MRLATDEDLLRDFGPEGFLIGLPVRPTPPEDEPEPEGEAPASE